MSVEAYAEHLERPLARGHAPRRGCTGAAGGAACGDLVRVSLEVDGDSSEGLVRDAGFDARGCGAATAAGSAAVSLVQGRSLLDAARVDAAQIARELGGLHASRLHAAELAADALHRALGRAAREQARLARGGARTLVAMSGGVDSAVAALLVCEQAGAGLRLAGGEQGGAGPRAAGGEREGAGLRAGRGEREGAGLRAGRGEREGAGLRTGRGGQAGASGVSRTGGAASEDHPVVAVTLELWSDPENDGERSCCSAQAVRSARRIAHGLGLAHLSIDLREEFAAGVVQTWIEDHRRGLTPNPCVRCNGSVRLDAMLELAGRLGAEALATGHYARVQDGLLRVAADEVKDQSYALAALSTRSLARMRFPLGELSKAQVRERALRAGLAVARRPDSQDLCFLAGTRHERFLARHGGLQARPGAIVDARGRALGEHGGVHTVTVGQRRGLGLAGRDEPLYVTGVDAQANTVTVGPREGLLCDALRLRDVTLHREAAVVDAVKVRYRGRRMACRLQGELAAGRHALAEVHLLAPAERTAAGQIACLYAGERIVGHGTIAACARARPSVAPANESAAGGGEPLGGARSL